MAKAAKHIRKRTGTEKPRATYRKVQPVMPENWNGPQFLSPENIVAITGLSWPTIKRLRRAGKFPQPVPISANRVGFVREHVEGWIRERAHGVEPREVVHAGA